MKIIFLGAAHEVTGSCTLIEACGKKILVDCGMEQGRDIYENCDIPIAPNTIDCIFLTHAHIDHSGKLPYLTANGSSASIHSTYATHRLCEIMLRDSAHIQETEAEWKNRKAQRAGLPEYVPPYTMQDAMDTLALFQTHGYNEEFEVLDGVKARFIDAGHLLGSASVEITISENGVTKTLLFSGDIGNVSRPLIRDPQKPSKADIVIIESTYGTRVHGERADYLSQITDIIQRTLDRGGNVIIPAFAVGRTQELLYLIREIKENGLVKNHDGFAVWVDSPLAVEATNIYSHSDGMRDYYDDETLKLLKDGKNPIRFDGLCLSVTSEDSKLINENTEPKVILSASGMCEAGRIRHHLKHNLWKSESTILFVGYQSEGTLGRKLLDGADSIKLFGDEVTVNAHIEQMDGISGHADKEMLLDWLSALSSAPETVYVNHGGDTVCDEFAKEITDRLGYKAIAPYNGAEYDIVTGVCLEQGNKTRLVSAPKPSSKASLVYERLMAAGQRLLSVIRHNKGGANKDLSRFATEINNLCDKWDR